MAEQFHANFHDSTMIPLQAGALVSEPRPDWAPRWYIWDGGFLAVGRSAGVVPQHSHHAIQIVIGVDAAPKIRGADGDWIAGHGMIVRPDVEHAFDGDGVLGAMLFVDPESQQGRWLLSSLAQDITIVPAQRVAACARELRTFNERPLEAMEFAALVRHCVQALCAGPAPSRRLDDRIVKVLDHIRASEDLKITLDNAAALVYLSPSRFAHLFAAHVGLPFRRYVLWRKLTRCMLAVSRGHSLSAAAHVGGFADSAHLTRTFYQMFGIPPSVMMRGDFYEVPSPFDVA